ncbi:hypothetical protein AVEN_124879-1 [Araneus ventricosus]|uniref:Uncharacterized protein n=1 Tax=Araneus ventricosus TaxID=182803 RepID=A0A4Y2TXA7_ARAVE|nr:hypothetical protein AVEN_124879-1 [Araneus ventricosus]
MFRRIYRTYRHKIWNTGSIMVRLEIKTSLSTPFGPTAGLVPSIQADQFMWVIHEGSKTHYRSLLLVLSLSFTTTPLHANGVVALHIIPFFSSSI